MKLIKSFLPALICIGIALILVLYVLIMALSGGM
jgi:hypothetical protein